MSDVLHEAVKAGNKETVEKLISFGADVNFVSNHKSPLMYCLDTDIANILLLNGADVKLKSGDRNLSALLNLFLHDDTDKECNNEKIKTTDEMLEVILELTKLYLNHGADINDKDSKGKTALMLASSLKDHAKVITYLLESGADYTLMDHYGRNAFYYAINLGLTNIVEVFLKFPIDVNVPCTSTGLTALHLAAMNSDIDMLRLLVSYKADLEVVDRHGNTVLMNALKSSGKGKDAILFLLDTNLNINHQNKDGKTAIMIAAEESMTAVLTLLCDKGADLAIRNYVDNKNVLEIMLDSIAARTILCKEKLITCTDNLLRKGGLDFCVDKKSFFYFILDDEVNLVQRLIYCGVCPMDISEITLKEDRYTFRSPAETFSPFWYALMIDNLQLARYFINISFLTLSDCCFQQYVTCRNHLVAQRYKQCLEFVDELYSKPMPLEKLSLVTVSSLIGPGVTRESKVKGLQLPVKFKDQLLFRTEDTLRTVAKEERHVTLAFPFIITDFLSDSDSDY